LFDASCEMHEFLELHCHLFPLFIVHVETTFYLNILHLIFFLTIDTTPPRKVATLYHPSYQKTPDTYQQYLETS
jgi:hypothetical protein